MGLRCDRTGVKLFAAVAFLGIGACLFAQGVAPAPATNPASPVPQAEVPDAPAPQIELAQATDPQSGQAGGAQQPSVANPPANPAQAGAAQSSSTSQNSAAQPQAQETKQEKAQEQVKEEEHQRVAGIVPSFNVTYHADAVSLTPEQKFELEFRAAIDPYTFSIALIVAGLGEAEDSNDGLGWGPGGYAKRAAAAYADNVIGNTLGNAVLPSILHQDPRYFRLGHGSVTHRILYSFATTFICKHDNTGKWEPNYSNVLGNMLAGEISTLYYPNSKSDAVQAIETGFTVTFEGAFGSELQEFWPDISRKFFHKDPTHGLDAQARAADAEARQKKQQENNAKDTP